jgi:hypothetical protein
MELINHFFQRTFLATGISGRFVWYIKNPNIRGWLFQFVVPLVPKWCQTPYSYVSFSEINFYKNRYIIRRNKEKLLDIIRDNHIIHGRNDVISLKTP